MSGLLLLLMGVTTPGRAATLTVAKDGSGTYSTISQALAAAKGGDTITVGPGTYAEVVSLGGKSVNLRSTDGSASTIIDGTGAGSYTLSISSGETAVVDGFTVLNTGGNGVVIQSAKVWFTDLVVEGTGTTATAGGAIVSVASTVSIDQSTFSGNLGSYGGAVYFNGGSLEVRDSTFEEGAAWYGAALYIDGRATSSFSGVTFADNESDASGGALFLDDVTTTTIEDSSFEGNINETGHGGAIYADSGALLTIEGSTFTDNYCPDYVDQISYGGAIRAVNYVQLTIRDSTFDGNQAYYGGAIGQESYGSLTIEDTVFEDNFAYYAGGIYSSYGNPISVTDSRFEGNTGYYGFSAVWVYAPRSAIFERVDFIENSATYGYGGALGAYYVSALTLKDVQFVDNYAYYYGGAAYIYYSYGLVDFSDVLIQDNTARHYYGGGIYLGYGFGGSSFTDVTFDGNAGGSWGGGLYAYYISADLERVSFTDNAAGTNSGGGLLLHGITTAYGFEFNLHDVLVADNESGGDGGGIAVIGATTLKMSDVSITGNESGSAGGGMYAKGLGTAAVERVWLAGNEAVYGGGLYLRGTESDLEGDSSWTNLLVQQNSAEVGGGICLIENARTSFVNNTLVGNSATQAGASVCLYDELVDFRNNIVSYDDSVSAVHVYDQDTMGWSHFEYNDWYRNVDGIAGGEAIDGDLMGEGTQALDPLFAMYDGDVQVHDDSIVLARDSLLIDQGDPAILDPDGSISDMGAFGGPRAPTDDADGDGHQAWIDCDDADPAVFPGAVEIWYDGINGDCTGASDFDQDGDGEEAEDYGGVDCDDTDASITSEDCEADEGGGEDGAGEDGTADDTGGEGSGDDGAGDGGGTGGSTDPGGCGGCSTGAAPVTLAWLLGLGALSVRRRRD